MTPSKGTRRDAIVWTRAGERLFGARAGPTLREFGRGQPAFERRLDLCRRARSLGTEILVGYVPSCEASGADELNFLWAVHRSDRAVLLDARSPQPIAEGWDSIGNGLDAMEEARAILGGIRTLQTPAPSTHSHGP